jgi:hypothetical protein
VLSADRDFGCGFDLCEGEILPVDGESRVVIHRLHFLSKCNSRQLRCLIALGIGSMAVNLEELA